MISIPAAPPQVLLLEDSPLDAELVSTKLDAAGFGADIRVVVSGEQYRDAVEDRTPIDLILADHDIPGFDGFSALRLACEHRPDVPFIFVSGKLGEEHAIESLQQGATDYVFKQRIERLVPAVRRALDEARARRKGRQAERDLALTRERLDAALAAGDVATWLWDLKSDLIYADQNLLRMFGLSNDATNGMTSEKFYSAIHSDDRDEVGRCLRQSLENASPSFRTECRVTGTDGVTRWVLARGTVERDESGQPVRLPGVVLDVTERKRAEQAVRASESRFRQLADSMPQIIWVARRDGHHEYFNQRWYEFTGVPEGSADGDGWSGLFHPDDQAAAWERWRQCLTTGEPYEIEYRLRHRSGEYRWMLGRALSIRDEQGNIERWFGTCTDIESMKRLVSERETLLDRERTARTQAEHAGQLKDEFLATLSHELRTPLNAILGWARILASPNGDKGPEAISRGLAVINRNARAQSQLIEDLLDMSRIISGKVRLDVQRVELAEVIEAALETVKPAAEARGVRLRKVLDPLAGPVSGDPNRLQQIVWNLLSNAIKFTERGGSVEVLLERVNSHLEITVSDSGDGIDPAFLPHVFDRFRQADGSTTRRHGGLGLGLSIVKHLVELHGGAIKAKSPGVGKGATFIVELPVAPIRTEVAGANAPGGSVRRHPTARLEDQHDCFPRLDGVRVLVVDDDPDARELMRHVLGDCGAEVLVASDADSALTTLREERPAVLVSDIGMPGSDGYDLIRSVRALPAEQGGRTPALALTAFARPDDRRHAIAVGYQIHLAKPADPAELITVVGSLAGILPNVGGAHRMK